MPYNVAFKLVTVSGPIMLPAAAYSFAKGMRAPWPAPPAFAIAAFGMLVQARTDWNIYGGNIASTLAGEFSFEIALALALFALGALAYTLDTGQATVAPGDAHRGWRSCRTSSSRSSWASRRSCSGWCVARAHVADRGPGRRRRPRAHRGVVAAAAGATGVHAEHAVREGVLDRQHVQAAVLDLPARSR